MLVLSILGMLRDLFPLILIILYLNVLTIFPNGTNLRGKKESLSSEGLRITLLSFSQLVYFEIESFQTIICYELVDFFGEQEQFRFFRLKLFAMNQ